MGQDLLLLSPAQIEAAASVGRLARLAERLVEEQSWGSLDLLLGHAALESVPLSELVAAAGAIDQALERSPAARSNRPAAIGELRSVRLLTGRTIARRLRNEALTADERDALSLAGKLFMSGGQPREAARVFARANDDARAADAYAAFGDIDSMEACHARIEAERAQRIDVHRVRRQVEADITAGQRMAALTLMQALAPAKVDGAGLRATLLDLEQRMCRGRAVVLSRPDEAGWTRRFSGTPAVLGRDPTVEIPLRDPGVSRRHAVIVEDNGHLAIEDAASRSGTTLGGARLASRVCLGGNTELALGQHCRVALNLIAPGTVEVSGLTGLERSLRALVSSGTIDLGGVIPGADGVSLSLDGAARLEHDGNRRVRVAGHLVGETCDLLHGDLVVIETSRGEVTLEVQ